MDDPAAKASDPVTDPATGPDPVAARLRRAGCVFAEQETEVLRAAALEQAGTPWARPSGPAAESPTASVAALDRLVRRREAGEPLEHLVGWVDFGSLRLAVGPGVFVPRQRSRHLARRALAVARRQVDPVVLEVCAGVAPIAAVLARALPRAEVHVTDVDAGALVHARRNLPPTAQVHCGRLLDAVPADVRGRVTVMVAVPPYVPDAAAEQLPREAREHEPARALLGGPDGLEHVRALLEQGPAWLTPDGCLLVELNPSQCRQAASAARGQGWRARGWTSSDGQTGVLSLSRPGR